MKLLVDGKEIAVQNDVKVIYDDVCIDMDADTEEEVHGELHATLTHEGLIMDLINTDDTFSDDVGAVVGTFASEYGHMATWCRQEGINDGILHKLRTDLEMW